MKLFFYVQHLLGIGHLRRAATLARAFRAAGFEVTLASGGMPVKGFDVSLQLPPARATDATFKTLVDEAGRPLDAEWKRTRAAQLLEAFRAARPDVLVVELFPFGRRQMRFELVPLLEDALRLARRPLIVCSVRDLIHANPAREEERLELALRFFDRVLVHGDPRLAPFERTFAPAARLGARLHYTGYVVDELPLAQTAPSGEVLVSAGGGAVGARLLATAIQARSRTLLASAPWRVLAGVNAADADLRALQREAGPGVVVERSRVDFQRLLAAAALSISQAGYNTVAETLRAGVRAVFVPFAAGAESEQTLRAQLLAERGIAACVGETGLSSEKLAAAVDRAVRGPRPRPADFDLDGARESVRLVKAWLQ
jgi:predicted glycosyltransferase